jgi:hypothetical protein
LGAGRRLRIDKTNSAGAPEVGDEPGWDFPSNFESGLEDLVLAGRATRHVRDDGQVLYEMQWSRAIVCRLRFALTRNMRCNLRFDSFWPHQTPLSWGSARRSLASRSRFD